MSIIRRGIYLAIVSVIVASCGMTDQVVSNHLISKRKYTKGYHSIFKRNECGTTAQKHSQLEEDLSSAEKENTPVEQQPEIKIREEENVAVESKSGETTVNSEDLDEAVVVAQSITKSKNKTSNVVDQVKLATKKYNPTKSFNNLRQKIKTAKPDDSSSLARLVYLIAVLLLIILIVILFRILDGLLGGLLSLLLLILIIYLILKFFDVI